MKYVKWARLEESRLWMGLGCFLFSLLLYFVVALSRSSYSLLDYHLSAQVLTHILYFSTHARTYLAAML